MTNSDRDTDEVNLGNGWVEKDGEVEQKQTEEVLPQAEPSDDAAPLP